MEIRRISEAQREALRAKGLPEVTPAEGERTRATETHKAAQRIFEELLEREAYSETLDFMEICEKLDVPYLVRVDQDLKETQ